MDKFHTIRARIVNGKGAEIRDLLLTEQQIELVCFINLRGKTTAAQISKIRNVSIQNASSKLSTLYKKGYLIRDAYSAESGGIEFGYMVSEDF